MKQTAMILCGLALGVVGLLSQQYNPALFDSGVYRFQPGFYVSVWTNGPYGDYLSGSDYATGPTSLMADSQDMTGAGWAPANATVADATHFTASAQWGGVAHAATTAAGVNYTLYLRAATAGGASGAFWHSGSATGNSTAQSVTATLTDYAVTVLGKAGGGTVSWGFLDGRASGWTAVEVTRWMVIPGTRSASEAAALYERVDASRQDPGIYDWSGHANLLLPGGTTAAETSDPADLVESYNKLAAGSTEDLTDATWVLTDASGGASVDSATQVTFGAHGSDSLLQTITNTLEGAYYQLSVELSLVSGDADIRLAHLNSASGTAGTAFAITATPTRYSTVVLGRVGGGIIKFGLINGDASVSVITATNWQLERVPSGTTDPLPYVSSAEPVFVGAHADYDGTDDLSTAANITLASDWTFHEVLRADDSTSVGLWRNGSTTPKVSLDTDSIPVYNNGTDTVRASYPNLLKSFEDMTGDGWVADAAVTIDDATHLTFGAQYDWLYQSVTQPTGEEVTLYLRARRVTGNVDLQFYHSGLTPAITAQTFTGTLADYAVTVTADGGAILFGVRDGNSSGFGQIEVTRWAVFQGTYSAAEAAALYQAASTFEIPVGLWHLLSLTNIGGTIQFYLDGVALGSGATTVSNAFADITLGYDGVSYLDGAVPFFAADDSGHGAAKVLKADCEIAQQMWDERSIAVHGALANCSTLAFE